MKTLRALVTGHRRLAALLLAMTLALKVLVPGGYMLGSEAGGLTVQICSGMTSADGSAASLTIPMDRGGSHGDVPAGHANAAKECPFTALAMHALSAADPLVLALAMAFVLALGLAAAPPLRLVRPAFLTPPLRGPPATS